MHENTLRVMHRWFHRYYTGWRKLRGHLLTLKGGFHANKGFTFLGVGISLAGCMGPVSLHKAVLNYDETISRLEREMLLINIARTHRDIPSHFTVTSNIAATFDYQPMQVS